MLYAILDTNVFLEFRLFTSVPWKEVLGTEDFVLVVAPIVVREIDDAKSNPSKPRKKRERARKALRILHTWLEDDGGYEGPSLSVVSCEPDREIFTELRLDPEQPDDRLIATAIEVSRANTDDEVVLVSDDLGPKLKGRQVGLKSLGLSDELRLKDASPEEQTIAKLEKELAAIKSQTSEPCLECNFGQDEHGVLWLPNCNQDDHAAMRSEMTAAVRAKHPLSSRPDELAGWNPLSRPLVATTLTLDRKDEYTRDYYARYDKYIDSVATWKWLRANAHVVKAVLANIGTAAATKVTISLSLSGATFVFAKKSLLEQPEAPTYSPPMYGIAARADYSSLLSNATAALLPKDPDLNVVSLSSIEVTLSRLQHTRTCALPVIYLVRVPRESKPIELNWRVISDEMRAASSGTIRLVPSVQNEHE